jgi:HlyD family secretion protein
MKNKKILMLPVLLALAVAAVIVFRIYNGKSDVNPDTLTVSGNIEVVEAEASFKIPGRVTERLVDEGDAVKKGQILARMDVSELEKQMDIQSGDLALARAALADLEAGSRPEEIAVAAADVQRAQAALDKLLTGARPEEIKASDAQVRTADAQLERVKSEYARAVRLYESGVISERDLVAAKTTFDSAVSQQDGFSEQKKLVVEGPRKEDIAQARAALMQAKERYALVKEGPRKQAIVQARARVAQAESALSLAGTRLGYAELKSPMGGIVVAKNTEPGEYVSPGTPIVTIGNLNNVFLRAYIDETDLGRVKTGQKVCVSEDTHPGEKHEGRISFIAPEAEFTPKNVQTTQERVKLVYRIKIAISNSNAELKPGMPADAEILLNHGDRCK